MLPARLPSGETGARKTADAIVVTSDREILPSGSAMIEPRPLRWSPPRGRDQNTQIAGKPDEAAAIVSARPAAFAELPVAPD